LREERRETGHHGLVPAGEDGDRAVAGKEKMGRSRSRGSVEPCGGDGRGQEGQAELRPWACVWRGEGRVGCKLDSQSMLCALPRQSKRWETLWPMMEHQQGMGKYYGHTEGRKK
jgi:hypothetical protein